MRQQNNKIYMDKPDKKKDITGYDIETEIGRGASGTCYKAIRKSDGHICAIKKIAVDTMKHNSLKLAMKEVAVLKSIDHPNIIKYFDSFADEHYLYIVMQYAAKGDLHTILKKRKIKAQFFMERELWIMAKQILDALKYLHANSIVHRDIKTLNIFMDDDGSLLLGDLGVSKILKNDLGLYSRVGTPLYLAPQIIKYEKYDYKADIWGLGCVMYLLATLNHPFQGKNIVTLGQNILQTEPKPIKNYTPELQAFIFKMLQKNPFKRADAHYLLKNQHLNLCQANRNNLSPQKYTNQQKKRISSQSNNNMSRQKNLQKNINPARNIMEFRSQKKMQTNSGQIRDKAADIFLERNSSHFKVVLPIKDFNNFIKVSNEQKKPLNIEKANRTGEKEEEEIKRKHSAQETIILKPKKNRFYQYCIPTEKTQIRCNHKDTSCLGKDFSKQSWEEFKQAQDSKRDIKSTNKDEDLFSVELKKKIEMSPSIQEIKREVLAKEDKPEALFHELVCNKVRTEENRKDIAAEHHSANIVRKRDIKSAYPGKPINQKDYASASSHNFTKDAVCVNVNRMFFEEENRQRKNGLRPQSSMGRKFVGHRQIKYIRKKIGNQLNLAHTNTKTQLLNKPEMVIL